MCGFEDAVFLLLKTTVKQARKLLGSHASLLTDEDIKHDIEAATFFCNIFIDFHTKNRKLVAKTPQKCHNTALYGRK